MKKMMVLEVLNEYIDWNTTTLPAGLYLDSGNNFVAYEGKNAYPAQFFIGNMAVRMLEDVPEQQVTPKADNSIAVDDVVKIIVAARCEPNNIGLKDFGKNQ